MNYQPMIGEYLADHWSRRSLPAPSISFTPLPPGHGCWGMIADLQLDPGLPSLTQCNNPHPPTLHCRTPSILQPFTLSPSFAPTELFSTRSFSTATGGKYRPAHPPRPAPPHPVLQQLALFRFNVDCAASEGLYSAAEGAFGTAGGSDEYEGGDAGSCPAAEPLSPDQCAGQVSTCWSPGQRDTDCPGNGLCCVSI